MVSAVVIVGFCIYAPIVLLIIILSVAFVRYVRCAVPTAASLTSL